MATVNTAWDHVSQNVFKTYLIMFFFSLFVIGVIYILAKGFGPSAGGGEMGSLGIVGIALIVAGMMNLVSYYFSDKIVLGVSGAKELQEKDNKQIYHLVENLCLAVGLPAPKIYVISDTAPNAFATGRDPKHAALALTSGIIQKLDKTELEGVIAHELSHIGNKDTLLMSVVSVLVGTVALLSDWFLRSMWFGGRDNDRENSHAIFVVLALVAAILAPIVATLIQLAISRRREFLADASGVLITRYPQGLASALLKISSDKELLEVANRGTAHLYIVNPLKGQQAMAIGWFANLFNTHPKVEARIKALREMEGLSAEALAKVEKI